jgi:hypothetical protein
MDGDEGERLVPGERMPDEHGHVVGPGPHLGDLLPGGVGVGVDLDVGEVLQPRQHQQQHRVGQPPDGPRRTAAEPVGEHQRQDQERREGQHQVVQLVEGGVAGVEEDLRHEEAEVDEEGGRDGQPRQRQPP